VKRSRTYRGRLDFLSVFLGNILASASGLIVGLLLAKGLEPEGRGLLAIALTWSGLALNFLGFGLRNASAYFTASDATNRGAWYSSALVLSASSTGLIYIVGFSFIFLTVVDLALRDALVIAFLATPFAQLAGISRGALQSIDLVKWSVVKFVQPMAYFMAVMSLYTTDSLTVRCAAGAYFASLVLAAIVAWLAVRSTHTFRREGCTFARLRSVFGYGMRSTLTSSAQVVNVRLDVAVLGIMLSHQEVGIYAVAASLALYVVPLSTAAAPWVFPRIAREKNLGDSQSEARRALLVSAGMAIGFAGIAAVLGPIAIDWILGEEWLPSIVPMWILLVAAVFQAIRFVQVSIANALNRPELGGYAEISAAIVTLIALWPAVTFFGINGAAVTTLLAALTSATLLAVSLSRAFSS